MRLNHLQIIDRWKGPSYIKVILPELIIKRFCTVREFPPASKSNLSNES